MHEVALAKILDRDRPPKTGREKRITAPQWSGTISLASGRVKTDREPGTIEFAEGFRHSCNPRERRQGICGGAVAGEIRKELLEVGIVEWRRDPFGFTSG